MFLVKEKTRGGKGRKVKRKRKGREGREEVSLSEGNDSRVRRRAVRNSHSIQAHDDPLESSSFQGFTAL